MAFHLILPLGPGASEVLRWLAWLCTYCAHAALWAAAAALLARGQRSGPAAQNQLWRSALLGPLLTTALAALGPRLGALPPAAVSGTRLLRAAADAPWAARESLAASSLGLLLVAAGALGLLRFVRSLQLLARVLATRADVSDARLCARLEALRARSRVTHVRLSQSTRVPGPLIVGRAEICVPCGALESYSDDEVDAIFAHELAHLERRDDLWFPLVGLVEHVLWMQPLNHWLAGRYRHSAELACDDRALQLTAAPMALARALTHMAELALRAPAGTPAPAMASDRRSRLERVRRLVAASAAPAQPKLGARWLALIALAVIIPCLGVEAVRALPARPDAAAYEADMRALDAEARAIERRLTSATGADLLEQEQALRHVRETQAWTEHAYTGALDAWEHPAKQ